VVVPSTSFKHLCGGQSSSLGENNSTLPFVTHHTSTFSKTFCIFLKWNSSPYNSFHLSACYNFFPLLRGHQIYFVSFDKLQCKIPIPTYVRSFTSLYSLQLQTSLIRSMWTYFHFWRWSTTFLNIPHCICLHLNKTCPNNWSNQVKTSNSHAIWVYFNYAKWHTLCTLGYVIFCCFMDLAPLTSPLPLNQFGAYFYRSM
jgi:hypothetical protein